jgi:hypothetical protein
VLALPRRQVRPIPLVHATLDPGPR